ncbi:hypothetical protein [Simkania sp.]|uniref:hypothetical protein n=1 Tax=Simkania sp. TaxID=34094 RepID=UPI003B52C1B9
MKLDLECTWNEKQKKVKQSIHFDFRPKSIFLMPDEVTARLQQLAHSIGVEGPRALEELKNSYEQYPKSVYAGYVYHRALIFFELFEEADELFQELRNRFEGQLLIKSILAYQFLREKKYADASAVFDGVEVLKGAFPRRKQFFFEEAFIFHHFWACYFLETGDELQSEKHQRLMFLITNTFKSFCASIDSV